MPARGSQEGDFPLSYLKLRGTADSLVRDPWPSDGDGGAGTEAEGRDSSDAVEEEEDEDSEVASTESEPGSTSREDPDVERMLRVRDGDDEAFRELFLKHSEALLNLAFRFVGSRARAEEIVQEGFLRIYRASSRYEPRARFRTYASRVIINLCLNELRRVEQRVMVDPEANGNGNGSESSNNAPREFADPVTLGGDGSVAARDIHRRVEKAIARLPRTQKTALLLTRFDGYSYRQVAEVLETTNDAVKALVARATRTLRSELGDLIE